MTSIAKENGISSESKAPHVVNGNGTIQTADPKLSKPRYKVKLERVLGLTVTSNAALDCDPNSGIIAYPAGCTVVLLNPRKNKQTHLLNAGKKAISCLSFSSDGRYLATGETGHMPSVRVWDLQDRLQVAEFTGHKFAINCVAFSPTQKHVVSVGSQHDMIVNVWDWRNNAKVASNKVSSKVKAISFAENGSYFVTVGNRHVKFWYLEHSRGSSKFKEPVPLMGRSAILGEQRNNYFCDVACGRGEMGDSTFAITKSGLLCEFNSRRLLDKWVELRTSSANCLVVGEEYIFIGCADGIVRCFSPLTLQFVTTLPRTHYLGVDVARGLTISHMASQPVNAKYPDAIAVTLDEANHKVTCIYSDHSMYIWDVHDIRRVGKSYSFLFHSACIWGVEVYPVMEGGYKGVLPPGSFMTCSSDDTIRVWNLDPNMANNTLYKRNIYSNDLLKVLYMDSDYTYLCDVNQSFSGSTEKTDSSCDGKNGVRCLCVRPDGKHLASGDRTGNIRIHELQFMDEICKIEAHDAEVLCLEYCKQGQTFLASASRDRLIHLFDVGKDYSLHQTLDDHSSSITAVRFVTAHGEPLLLSCGADKSIIFRRSQQALGQKGGPQYSRFHHVSGKTTLYDMELDLSRKHILTACQDRNIRVYNVSNGKHSKTFKGTLGEEGTLIKLVLDRSGMYIATSCTDKSLCIYDYYNGECMATMFGHSELVTGLRFSNDCRHLISVSGDGCIFIWKIPTEMTQAMTSRLAQLASKHGRRATHSIPRPFGGPGHDLISASAVDLLDQNANDVEESEYRFSIGQLPLWAKKQIAEAHSPPLPMGRGGPELPKGRWAQRIESQAITVRSHYDSDSVIPLPIPQGDSESSKDSSLESSGSEEPDADFIPCPDNYQKITREIPDFELSGGRITLKRGSAFSETRSRHLTDDSSSSSFKFEEGETEHDGDVEDSENEDGESPDLDQPEPLLYLPQSQEPASDFLVKETDQEELRKSQRRHRKARAEKPLDISIISASASQESEEEDGDVSTPSAETAERNIMSMLAISTESLDQVALRETFLKSNFETLHDDRGGFQSGSETSENTSLSSRFLRQNSRNSDIIEAAKQSLKDPEISRRRLELQRQIEETRKKLQSVGYKSNLNTSRSITDLSSVPEKEDSSRYKGGKFFSRTLPSYFRNLRKKVLRIPQSAKEHRCDDLTQNQQSVNVALPPIGGGSQLQSLSFEFLAHSNSTVIATDSKHSKEKQEASKPQDMITLDLGLGALCYESSGKLGEAHGKTDVEVSRPTQTSVQGVKGPRKRLTWHRLSCPEPIPEVQEHPQMFGDGKDDGDVFPMPISKEENLRDSPRQQHWSNASSGYESGSSSAGPGRVPSPESLSSIDIPSRKAMEKQHRQPSIPRPISYEVSFPNQKRYMVPKIHKETLRKCHTSEGSDSLDSSCTSMDLESVKILDPWKSDKKSSTRMKNSLARKVPLPDVLPSKRGGRNGGEGGLRRACSLSDLSQPSPAQRRILPSPPNQVSGKATTGKPGQGHVKSIRNPAFPNGYERNDNPSDSEGEIPSVHRSSGVVTMSRMTRPTMSSMQKQQGHMGGRGTARGDRVGPKSSQHSSFAKSTGDLRRPAEGYSSSEETSSNENKPKPSKSSGLTPASRRISSSEKELNRTAREVTDRLNVPRGAVEKRNVRRASSVITGTRQGCEEASENLKEASETLATLYQRVSMDLSFNEVERASFLAILQAGAQEARMTLDSIMYPMNPGSGETSRKGSTNNPVMMQMMQQYSDLLVNMVQQRMQSPASSSSTLMASADNTEEVIAVNGHEAPPVSQALTPS